MANTSGLRWLLMRAKNMVVQDMTIVACQAMEGLKKERLRGDREEEERVGNERRNFQESRPKDRQVYSAPKDACLRHTHPVPARFPRIQAIRVTAPQPTSSNAQGMSLVQFIRILQIYSTTCTAVFKKR